MFPGGGHNVYIKFKLKSTTNYSTKEKLNVRYPYAYPPPITSSFTCNGFDLSVRQWGDYDGFVCYPIKMEVLKAGTTEVVASKDNILSASTNATIEKIPYGNYNIVFTGNDGGKWSTSNNGIVNWSFNKLNYNISYYAYRVCREDGNTGYISVLPTNLVTTSYFIPGTIIRVKSAPQGQPIPADIVITSKNQQIVYPFGNPAKLLPSNNSEPYVIEVIGPCGTPAVELKTFFVPGKTTYYYNYSSHYCQDYINKSYGYFYVSSNDAPKIPGGTVFTYVSGGNPASVVHKNFTMPSGASSYFNPFSASYDYTGYMEGVDPGTYVFDVKDGFCNTTTRVSIDMPKKYTVKDFTYSKEYTCNGLKISPTGYIQFGGDSRATYFRISKAVDFNGKEIPNYDKRSIKLGESFLLQENGVYTLQISIDASNTSCASSTIEIRYEQPSPKLDMAKTASYVCNGKTIGYIKLVANGGFASGPFEYEILGTSLKNTTGIFNYGNPNQIVEVKITDKSDLANTLVCNPYFIQKISMLDLSDPSIAYSSNDGVFCEGSTIDLNCVTLGETSYSWTGPNGFTSNQQYIQIPNATVAMSGVYTVKVTPEHCGEELTQSVTIKINKQPVAPEIATTDIRFCYGSSSKTFLQATGAKALNKHILKWYESDGITEFNGSKYILTTAYYTNTYYVSQVNTETGCESQRIQFQVSIISVPLSPIVATPPKKCWGTSPLEFKVSNTNTSYNYKLYSSYSSTIPIDAKPGNGGLLTLNGGTYPVGNLYYYISAIDNTTGCESSPRASSLVEVSQHVTQNKIIIDNTSICISESVALKVKAEDVTNPTFYWYESSSSPSPIFVGDTYTTPVLTSSKYYYIAAKGDGYCETPPGYRKSVFIHVKNYAQPYMITFSNQTICEGESASINLSTPYVSNPVFNWYVSKSATTSFHTGDTYVIPELNQTTSYYVSLSGDNYCENLPNNRKEIRITVKPKAIVTAGEACPNKPALITINNAKAQVQYNVFDALTGGSLVGTGYRSSDGILNISTGIYSTNKTLYVQTADGYCNLLPRKPVNVVIKDVPAIYPDVRLMLCPKHETEVNLNSYLDMREFVSSNWLNKFGVNIIAGHKVKTTDLMENQIYVFDFSVNNNCYENLSGKLYLKTIGVDKPISYSPQEIIICKDVASNLALKQIMGIAEMPGGTWDYSDLNPNISDYISEVNGAIIFDGKKAYDDSKGVVYNPIPNASKIVFKYTTPSNLCGAPTSDVLTIILYK